ncbi:poly-gamma-glutamate synthase PgsB [bacterium]|jgi:gamma-polyglutamate synthase|nr:poly-gamma-glutamate synthase PgsB [bacterium]
MKLTLLLLTLLTVVGVWEMTRHRYYRRQIKLRVHVNGSRGKSSVARLITAGLQAGGLQVCTKTTGSAARFIHVDGTETPVVRHSPPNIREQLRVFRQAAREKADVLVLECMAVRPDLQWICEHKIVKATCGVITNVRPDHLEVQGPRLEDVCDSLGGTVPRGTVLVTAEEKFGDRLKSIAKRRGSQFKITDPKSVTDEDLSKFSYHEFADNVSLALDACEECGIDRAKALSGMHKVLPDVGALTILPCISGDKKFDFVNAFAANDPESSIAVWKRLGYHKTGAVALYNNRADRMRRAKDMAPIFVEGAVPEKLVVVGEATSAICELFARSGADKNMIIDLGGKNAAEICDELFEIANGSTVVGLGNIGGAGHLLIAELEKGEMS